MSILCAFASYYVNLAGAERDEIARADHFHRAGLLLDAADGIRRAPSGEPTEQLPVIGRAHLLMARGDAVGAEKLLDQARGLKDDGRDNVGPMLWKAAALFRRGLPAEALTWYKRALRTHTRAPACVRLGIGACQLKLGEVDAARAAFQRTLDLEPENPDALLGCALCEFQGASAVPVELLHADSDSDSDEDEPRTKAQRLEDAALAYSEATERGLNLLERAFNADPRNPAVNVALARHYLYVEDLPSVEQLTEALIGGGGETKVFSPRLRAEAAYARAMAHHDAGDLGRAQALYQASAQLDETFAAPSFGLAQCALARGDAKTALTYAERAHAAYPTSVPVMRVYGHLRRAADARVTASGGGGLVSVGAAGAGAGRDAATAAILKRAVDADAGDLECRIEYGDALLAAGEYVKALEAFETAAKLARREKSLTGGSTAALLNNCAALRAMAGRATGEPGSSDSAKETFLAALEAAARADEKAPETAKSGADLDASSAARRKAPAAALPVAFNLARLAEERGEDAEADARYDDLLAAAPGMTECLLRRAGMRARREDFDAAMALAEKAIESKPDDPDAMAYAGHLLMRQEKWKEATAMFKRLRALPKKLDAQAAQLAAAAGKDPEAATHQHDEYAMVSLANAAYYQAVKLQSSAKAFKHAPGMDKNAAKENDKEKAKLRAVEKEHLDHAATMYTKALQKSESNLFAANGLGILLADKGKVDEAKATFQLVAEGITAATADGAKAGDEGVADAAAQRLASSPDIWINQGHVQMAKGNYVAAARHYEQAQSQFFYNLDHRVMLYQARNAYDANQLAEARSFLRKALHVAPWNHRLRFNLAYVLQENANRVLNRTLEGLDKSKRKGSGVVEGRLKQVEGAIADFELARNLFAQLQTVLSDKAGKDAAATEFGFDKKRLRLHVDFCDKCLKVSGSHLASAQQEELAAENKRKQQEAARKEAENVRALQEAKREADEAAKKAAEAAVAAAAEEKFKQRQKEWLEKTASEREADAANAGNKRGKGAKAGKDTFAYDDDDDDNILAPDVDVSKPKTEAEKKALKETGLFSDSEEEEEAADTETDEEPDEDAKAKLKAAGLADSDSDDDDAAGDAKAADAEMEDAEAAAPEGRRARKEPEAKQKSEAKAKKALEALAAKSRKKRGLEKEEKEEEEKDENDEEVEDAASEGGAKKRRRKALVDDDDE